MNDQKPNGTAHRVPLQKLCYAPGGAAMRGTVEDFKAKALRCEDEESVDVTCFRWLKLTCMQYGTAGEHASKILDIVEDMLR